MLAVVFAFLESTSGLLALLRSWFFPVEVGHWRAPVWLGHLGVSYVATGAIGVVQYGNDRLQKAVKFPISVARQVVAHKELAAKRNVSAGLPAMPKPLEIGVFMG